VREEVAGMTTPQTVLTMLAYIFSPFLMIPTMASSVIASDSNVVRRNAGHRGLLARP
jgi:hypothetical protein